MIEHVMAALAGLRIDNCEIHINGEEIPGCDGSSQPFVEALWDAGVTVQESACPQLLIQHVTRVGNDKEWVEARPTANGEQIIRYELDYGDQSPITASHYGTVVTPQSFREELSPARTFLLQREAEWLRQQGIAQRVTARDVLVFGEAGVLDNELRFDDECARHKCLDMVGDLALTGCELVGEFIGHRSGHRLNAELARTLLNEYAVTDRLRASA